MAGPLNMGAFQLAPDITLFAGTLARLMGLHTHHGMGAPGILQGVIINLNRLDRLPEPTTAGFIGEAHGLAERASYLLDPPEDTKMIGWCPACNHELRADSQELGGGYVECPPMPHDPQDQGHPPIGHAPVEAQRREGHASPTVTPVGAVGHRHQGGHHQEMGATRRHPTSRP